MSARLRQFSSDGSSDCLGEEHVHVEGKLHHHGKRGGCISRWVGAWSIEVDVVQADLLPLYRPTIRARTPSNLHYTCTLHTHTHTHTQQVVAEDSEDKKKGKLSGQLKSAHQNSISNITRTFTTKELGTSILQSTCIMFCIFCVIELHP